MPFVIHHNDFDGKCAAAIVMNELLPIFIKDQIIAIEYNYGYKIDWDSILDPSKFLNKEICYIVDIALNDEIFGVIKKLINNNVKVIHIDHHQATFDYMSKDGVSEVMSKVTIFHNINYSGTMLSWVMSCMNDTEREHPMDIKFDFTSTYSHVMINVGGIQPREYKIYPGVFYIDDYDVWRHSDKDTLAFHYGLSTVEDTNPKLDKFWGDIIYGNQRIIQPYIESGRAIAKYKETDYAHTLKRGHEIDVMHNKCFIVNAPCDSFMFESIKADYDACIAYWYDAKIGKWHYSVRSADSSSFDCNEFCKMFGGGGHKHAAAFFSTELEYK